MHKKILCDICKEHIATVHYTEIVNNKLKKLDLCEECAKQKNLGVSVQFSVADILKGLTEAQAGQKEDEGKVCPTCGLTFGRFRKVGKLGCGDCYEAFVDFEVEETGEQGTGTAEYSLYPPYPQWLV